MPLLEEFAKVLSATQFTDYFWVTRRVRYRRPKSTFSAALDMEVSWSPGTHAPRYHHQRQVSGNARCANRWLAAGRNTVFNRRVPNGAGLFPWRDFKNVWCDLPYAIGDREK
jgi:hypothetical protein